MSAMTGSYSETVDWYGSWYANISGRHYDFMNEGELVDFLGDNIDVLSGTSIELYRGLTFAEAYARVEKTQDNGYYKQQELTKSMCNNLAITQNETVKDVRDNNTYMVGKLKDGNCWMLDNLALDPTDPTTAANMNASNTNATAEAITNYLNGGNSSGTAGWSSAAVANVTSNFSSYGYTTPRINNQSKDTLVASFGPAATNGQAKVGLYYNYCAATVGTYCYEDHQGVDKPDTLVDADQDICSANWRMPSGGGVGVDGDYTVLYNEYKAIPDATDVASLQYNLSTPLSGYIQSDSPDSQGSLGDWWTSTYTNSEVPGSYMFNIFSFEDSPFAWAEPRYRGLTMRCLVSE
jgi:hypothetical protein